MRDEWFEPDAPNTDQPPALDELLANAVASRGWSRRLRGARIHEHWVQIAGDQLARHSEPVRLHGGVLVLRVASPVWATQVRYLAGELVDRANAVLGAGEVEQIRVVTGPGRAGDG